jgi:hypothetical protein
VGVPVMVVEVAREAIAAQFLVNHLAAEHPQKQH